MLALTRRTHQTIVIDLNPLIEAVRRGASELPADWDGTVRITNLGADRLGLIGPDLVSFLRFEVYRKRSGDVPPEGEAA